MTRVGRKAKPAYANGRLYTLGMGGIASAVEAESGRLVWQRPATSVLPLYGTALSPLVDGDRVILHIGGHDRGALTAFNGQTGAFSHRNSDQYVLLDVNTGRTIWTGPPRQATNAAIVGAGRIILSLQDDGALLVGRAAADGFDVLRRYGDRSGDLGRPGGHRQSRVHQGRCCGDDVDHRVRAG